MLNITIGTPITVSYVRTGVKQNGTPYSLIAIRESDNSENSRSKTTVKVWGDALPEGIKDGCKAVLTDLAGVRLVHEKIGERYGKPQFRDSYELIGASFVALDA